MNNILDRLQKFRQTYKLIHKSFKVKKTKNTLVASQDIYDLNINKDTRKYISKVPYLYETQFGNVTIKTTLSDPEQMKKLYKFCIFFSTFFLKEKNVDDIPINIYYIIDPNLGAKKVLNQSQPLSTREINSGICWDNNILIFRKEEAPKVIIHEMIHVYKIDIGIPPSIVTFIKSTVQIRFRETYTELLAALLYTEYISKTKNNRKDTLKELFDFFIHQADKVMCIYWNNFFVQDTHVFEYIVAKAALCKKYINDHDKLLELFDVPKQYFCNILKNAIHEYLSEYSCHLQSLPLKHLKTI